MHDDDRDPIDRLRDADPAADITPRDGFVDDVVATTTPDAAPAAPTVDLTAERTRRRPRRALVIAASAAAAAVVVAGAAGYGLGASRDTVALAEGADVAAPPISLQGTDQQGARDAAGAPSIAMGESSSAAGSADMAYGGSYGWGWGGRNVFSGSGFGTNAGAATGYGYDAAAASNAERVGALAAGLGVEGTPEVRDGQWAVGPTDGSGPTLGVSLDGALSFWYSANPQGDIWACMNDSSCTAPSEDVAVTALRDLLVAAGEDPEAFEYSADTWEGSPSTSAQAWPVVAGQRLDQAWYAEVTDAGVSAASGYLADLVSLGEYPIVSEQQALERLSDPRFGAQMTALPIALREGDMAGEIWTPPTAAPAAPQAGSTVSWPVTSVQLVSVRLGLASQWQADGSVLVVPTYEFTDAGGGTWSVIAVADEALDFATD